MPSITRKTDKKARLTLPRAFADCTVVIDQTSDNEIRIRKALVIPEGDNRFYEEAASPLSDRDRDIFLSALDNPMPPNEALRGAAMRHKRHG